MEKTEVLKRLCCFDKRNPHGTADFDPEDTTEPHRESCACDNCFYGRDKLAQEILKLQADNEKLIEACEAAFITFEIQTKHMKVLKGGMIENVVRGTWTDTPRKLKQALACKIGG